MWRTRLLPAVLTAFAVYLAGSLLVAPYGRDGRAGMESHIARLEENVRELETLHRRLLSEADLLRRSSDAVALEARRLGYYDESEQVIRLNVPGPARAQSPGTIVRRPVPPPDRSLLLRVAALAGFILALLASSFAGPEPRDLSQEIRRASR